MTNTMGYRSCMNLTIPRALYMSVARHVKARHSIRVVAFLAASVAEGLFDVHVGGSVSCRKLDAKLH